MSTSSRSLLNRMWTSQMARLAERDKPSDSSPTECHGKHPSDTSAGDISEPVWTLYSCSSLRSFALSRVSRDRSLFRIFAEAASRAMLHLLVRMLSLTSSMALSRPSPSELMSRLARKLARVLSSDTRTGIWLGLTSCWTRSSWSLFSRSGMRFFASVIFLTRRDGIFACLSRL